MMSPVERLTTYTSVELETSDDLNLNSTQKDRQIQVESQSQEASPGNVGQPVNSLQLLGIHYGDSLSEADSNIEGESNSISIRECYGVTSTSTADDESKLSTASSLQASLPDTLDSTLGSNELDSESEARDFRQKWINQNLEDAMETIPESYVKVPMVTVNCKINGHVIKAVVDTGSQVSVLSLTSVHECSLSSLLDRTSAMAVGCGSTPFIGCIKPLSFRIDNQLSVSTNAYVLDNWAYKMVVGLDVLRKYCGVMDFETNILRLRATPTGSEKEIKTVPMYHVKIGNIMEFVRPSWLELDEDEEDYDESWDKEEEVEEQDCNFEKLDKKGADNDEEREEEEEKDELISDLKVPAKRFKCE